VLSTKENKKGDYFIMKKKRKNLLTKVLAVFLVLTSIVAIPMVTYARNGMAFSVGTNYGDGVNTSSDATTACDMYGLAGYSSYYSTQPTYQIMRGAFSNGTKRMQSDVLFFSGHSNYDHMAFNYKDKGGDYKTGVYYANNLDSTTGYKYVGINEHMTYVKLVTYAGCNTASNDYNNITYASSSRGAKCAVGWTTKVGAGSHTNWLKRYNDKLASGSTVKAAVDYANSFTYLDSKVKNAKIFGNSSLVIKTSKSASKSVSLMKQEELKYIPISNDINVLSNGEVDTSIILSVLNQNNIKLDKENLKIETHKTTEENDYTIDFIEMYNGIETNSSYVAFVEDGILSSIVDNHYDNFKLNSEIRRSNYSMLSESTVDNLLTKAENKVLDIGASEIIDQGTKYYYDCENNTLKLIVFTEYYFDNTTAMGVSEYEQVVF